jgi:hypothetical protein
MKNKKHLFLGTLIMVMVFASVLAGCATPGGSETSPTLKAEQLAADLNAIKAGSATVEGATVRLSDEVYLTTGLTVPAEVTLDLTKEALKLGDNATFTVDGTVDAKAEGINVDSAAANPAVINGNGTIHLKSKGRLLGIWEGRKLTLDGVTMTGLADNNASLVEVGEGGELVIKGGAITGNANVDEENRGGGVLVGWKNATFTMLGGTISGNSVRTGNGGGVYVNGEGTIFTMSGGKISGNKSINDGEWGGSGGGVAVEGQATFTMTGGTISSNTATGAGGGVVVDHNSVFTMRGGTILGNTTEFGGGVFVHNGSTFTMEGGTIYGSSEGANANTAQAGAALRVLGGSTVKWGTGGAYTKGGVSQTGGTDIGDSDDTLIAIPAS